MSQIIQSNKCLDELEYLQNIYRRYGRIRLEALVEAVEILNMVDNKKEAKYVLINYINSHMDRYIISYDEKVKLWKRMKSNLVL